ncbi:MAG: AI-2E family transporter [Gammaproteobacteria bacterium]
MAATRMTFTSTNVLRFLLVLATLYTLYFAKSLLIPLVLALLIALLLSPLVTLLKSAMVPRSISSVIVLVAVFGSITLLTIELAGPFQKWAQALPEFSAALGEQIETISEKVTGNETDTESEEAELPVEERGLFARVFGNQPQQQVTESDNGLDFSDQLEQVGMEVLIYLLSATPIALVQMLTVTILILFLLIFGPDLLQTYARHSKRMESDVMDLFEDIRGKLSRYVLTISLINFALGAATAGALTLIGVEDALLWGVVCGLLNFAPYVGSLVSSCLLLIAGLVQYGFEWYAILPVAVFFILDNVEAQVVTPIFLGRNMRLNPLVMIVWVFIWAWLWGAIGVLLSVPILVCCKLIAKRLQLFDELVAVIESRG